MVHYTDIADMGYEFVVVQFAGHEAHFSTLINYQAHKENAPECLSMVHYTDIAEEKGIVLMVGEYDKDVLNIGEARSLVVQAIQYYGVAQGEEKKLGHLQRFTYKTEEFNHLDLILELEVNPGFSPAAKLSSSLSQLFKNPREAKCLADQVEIYYSRPTESKLELLNKFTNSPQYFSHVDLISEMNNLEIEAVDSKPAVEQKN